MGWRGEHHETEEIVGKLRQVEVLVGQGRPVAEAIRAIGVSELACEAFNMLAKPAS